MCITSPANTTSSTRIAARLTLSVTEKVRKARAGTVFDDSGVHFIGLVNVVDLKGGGLGNLGAEQLAWLEDDLKGKADSTPVVIFAHIPLWVIYPEWGWGTQDGTRALELLKRFGSVTILNGHIHQLIQKVEGNMTFHTAMSTAFPQPAPGSAPSPGPMLVPRREAPQHARSHQRQGRARQKAARDRRYDARRLTRGRNDMPEYSMQRRQALFPARGDALSGILLVPRAEAQSKAEVKIDNFVFAPETLTIAVGTSVTWVNHDDIPHTVVENNMAFRSKALDTNDSYSFTFTKAGTYDYFCSLHPHMKGKIVVTP